MPVQPIRLAFCITELAPGGAERCLVELALRLSRKQFTPAVYSLGPRPAGPQAVLAERLEEAAVPVSFFNARGPREALRVVRRLVRHLREQRPHLLQTFLWHANLVGPPAACWAGVPHVVTGIRVAEQRGDWRLWLERQAARLAQRHVCVSESVAEFARGQMQLNAENVCVIPNGVDLKRCEQAAVVDVARLGLPPRRFITLVGRLDPQKGIDWLLETATDWLPQLPEHDLLLVGDGPQRAALQRQVRQAGLEHRVHFAGWQENVPGLLKVSDLLVLTSHWEGMPNVVLEAMACGRPVLCCRVHGVNEVLDGPLREQLVPCDAGAFTRRLIHLAQSDARRNKLGRLNRKRVAERYSLEQMVAQYEQLYAAMVDSGQAAKT